MKRCDCWCVESPADFVTSPDTLRACMKDETVEEICESAFWWADAMLRERGTAVSDNCVTGNQREMECPVTEPLPKEKRAEVSEQGPAAWATFYPNGSTASVYIGRVPPHAVPLYRHPQLTLTDEERAAVERVCVACELLPTAAAKQVADTLSKLLERTK